MTPRPCSLVRHQWYDIITPSISLNYPLQLNNVQVWWFQITEKHRAEINEFTSPSQTARWQSREVCWLGHIAHLERTTGEQWRGRRALDQLSCYGNGRRLHGRAPTGRMSKSRVTWSECWLVKTLQLLTDGKRALLRLKILCKRMTAKGQQRRSSKWPSIWPEACKRSRDGWSLCHFVTFKAERQARTVFLRLGAFVAHLDTSVYDNWGSLVV